MKTYAKLLCFATVATTAAAVAAPPKNLGYQDTPLLPGGKWHVHDGLRPRPVVVTPAPAPATPVPPPADAIVLLGANGDLSKWRDAKGSPAIWTVSADGEITVTSKGGDIFTRDSFGDMQLHIEWRAPAEVKGSSQGRGNSGIFLLNHYELQVLDSYENPTYSDGQAGSVYGQTPPLVNPARKPGEWQSYDVAFTAPRVGSDGKMTAPPRITVWFNGVLVQNNTEILGDTRNRQAPKFDPKTTGTGPIRLQNHNNPVSYRNIWVRPLKPVPGLE